MSLLRPRRRKVIHFIRHAESQHNIPPYDNRLRDPSVTPHGREQATLLATQFPHLQDAELFVVSPMKRTVQTALLAFGDVLREKDMQLIAVPELQELSRLPCDTGSSLPELLTEWREERVDLGRVGWGWDGKDGEWSPTEQRTLARMNKFRAWLRDRPESNIVIVAHAHCMQLLTRLAPPELEADGLHEIRMGMLPAWPNCAWRSFTVEEDYAKVLLFEETRASRKAREKGFNVVHVDGDDKGRKRSDASSNAASSALGSKNSSRSPSLTRSAGPSMDVSPGALRKTKKGTWSSSSSLSREGRKWLGFGPSLTKKDTQGP